MSVSDEQFSTLQGRVQSLESRLSKVENPPVEPDPATGLYSQASLQTLRDRWNAIVVNGCKQADGTVDNDCVARASAAEAAYFSAVEFNQQRGNKR
jgi:hypothetical protein